MFISQESLFVIEFGETYMCVSLYLFMCVYGKGKAFTLIYEF